MELGLCPLNASVGSGLSHVCVFVSFENTDVGLALGTEIQTQLGETLDSALTSVRALDNGTTHQRACFSAEV